MTNNIQQFGLYTAKILDILYDSFPIPTSITRNEVIAEYLLFVREEELAEEEEAEYKVELKTKEDFVELFKLIDSLSYEIKCEANEALPKIDEQLRALESEQNNDQNKQIVIYEGTLEFLVSEELIRKSENGGYQLTSKSFTHLNKTFKDGLIEGKEKTIIAALRSVFIKTSSTSLDIASGTAINILTELLSYS